MLMNTLMGVYPDINSSNFYKIIRKKEFWDNRIDNRLYCLEPYQRLVSNFISPRTPYNSLLVYAGLGSGKTTVSIAVAEKLKQEYKVLVLQKNETLINNYIKELLYNKCFDDYKIKETKKENLKEINKYYQFITYNTILTQDSTFNLNNTLVIIDEVHNITEIKAYPVLLEYLKKSKNCKLLMLTATPVYDNIIEIFEINNLLNFYEPKKILDTIESVLFRNKLIEKTGISKSSLLKETSTGISAKGEAILRKTLKGKVSYLKNKDTNENFANINYIGTSIKKLKIVHCKMSTFQEKIYMKSVLEKKNNLFKTNIDTSAIVYPDGSHSINLKSYLNKSSHNNLNFLSEKVLEKFSCKLHKLLLNIKSSKGLVFIYSHYVNSSGIEIITNMLKQNGYAGKFAVLKGTLKQKTISGILEKFNSKENVDGNKIKILIGSPIINEGISIKNIRQIHIFEPGWNLSEIDQIIGRGVRLFGHSDLPVSSRNVDVFLYAAMTSDPESSIDYLKYKLSENKDISIKKIENLLKEVSFDCALNKVHSHSNNKDGSRECGYSKCNYTCNYTPDTPFKVKLDTYHVTDNGREEIHEITKYIKELFTLNHVFDVNFIVKYIQNKNKQIEKDNIFYVINEMINEPIKGINTVFGYLKLDKDVLYFSKKGEENTECKNQFYADLKTKSCIKPKKIVVKTTIVKKDNVNTPTLPDDIYGITGSSNGTSKSILTEFKVVYKKDKKNIDKRGFTTGKICTSYSKEILNDIVKELGGTILLEKGQTKERLCKIIYKLLVQSKNIISL